MILNLIHDEKSNNIGSDALLNPFGSIVLRPRRGQNGKQKSYEPETGRLLEILTLNGNDTIQENTYEYDKIANLAARTDHVHDMREDFIYDKLNRLTGIIEDNDTTARFDYDAYGRMLRKYMHSTLVFDSASYNAGNRPHAMATMPLNSLKVSMARHTATGIRDISSLRMSCLSAVWLMPGESSSRLCLRTVKGSFASLI